jgi:hypothetical protein
MRAARLALPVTLAALAVASPLGAATKSNKVAMTCSKGGDQVHPVTATAPDKVDVGAKYTIRIDGGDSGKIDHGGLRYVHDMEVEYGLPSGTTFVEGSAKIVAGTGTANVAKTATVSVDKGVVRLKMPARVDSGGSFTPPSVEVQVTVTAAVGSTLTLNFQRYSVVANAVVVGDVPSTCEPKTKPAGLVSTTVSKP